MILLLTAGLIAVASCKKDDPADDTPCTISPTYNTEVQAITTSRCATSGCHDGSGSAPGDFSSYQGLQSILTNGRFTQRVLVDKTMPQGISLPANEFEILRCWAANGFPQQ